MTLKTMNMPQLGESVTEGTISQWLVSAGDTVDIYQPLVDVMTDKVNAEVPSSFKGIIKECLVTEDETVAVGTPICHIEVEEIEAAKVEETARKKEQAVVSEKQSMKKRYSPKVLSLASEHGVDLSAITGTGLNGRITRKDVEMFIEKPSPTSTDKQKDISLSQPEQVHAKRIANKQSPHPEFKGDREIPVTGIRKSIAENMVRATSEIPHAWMMIEVDVTNLVNYRNAEKTKFKEQEGYNLSYFSFFLNAVAKALKKFPELNSSWQGDTIVQHKDINLSIAVGNETELYVPVIKNVDEKSIKGIAKDVHVLAHKAKHGQLTNEDMTGGTFTVNNTGTFGSVQSMGVINYPQAAILQVESIVKRPVIIDDMIAARDMVNLCLSLDHRVLDGVICGRFMSHVKGILENISGDTTPIY
ncbi:2-oxoisovalerate dehydrogenase E2 component (dihydrolipoyl transacylase) [Halolactibacillus halophilus]|uniref:Dihydrolipoamide acetyltransferase component of pyruvate dehydrogenase complex n=1 Tax=Halolactibacillus halophilus TaxID=306540 RepID=A0A1I5P629_9BACI|nr:dihydrolipoamide acetyltransferase family protein [Halolactibacillus halophilus]GEM01701.1 lipoamide acyltransferase component of branched-chain alpha-keto acid dehydrogenase complex [Halolactibacillus halophilus]SFP29559.1 2-oxoisovalerate dehydrogenase E2 component (dihydrolipoyl transacylase) [Halolactibacillus halophilus]